MNSKLLLALGAILLARPVSAGTLFGISNGYGVPANNQVYVIDPATGAVTNAVQVTLPGFTISNSTALAAHPTTGQLWAVVTTSDIVRRLIVVDPTTGVATQVGPLAKQIATLAFQADGTLLGVTGDGSLAPAETLFTISTTNAVLTQLFTLGNGDDGETIAVHPSGLLYHSSGNVPALFENVDVATQHVTPIGSSVDEAYAMGYSASLGQMYLSDKNSKLYTVDLASGARTLVGTIPSANRNRGLAFVEGPPPIPFCSPGLAGVIACPCANPASGPDRGCDNSAGTGGASLVTSGWPSVAADSLVFTTSGERPSATTILLQGTNAVGSVPFGQGVRCSGGLFKRLYVRTASGGSISVPQGADPRVSVQSAALGDAILGGQHRYYMAYYRDPVVLGGCPSTSTFNATNAQDVLWAQ